MNSVAQSLAPEWRRLDLLSTCVGMQRRGDVLQGELLDDLRRAQADVLALRAKPPWRDLVRSGRLSALDQDILAAVIGPDAEPRLGWAFHELQPGLGSPYPSVALLRELLFLDADACRDLHARVDEAAPLRCAGLLEGGGGSYEPLRPTARTRDALLGWRAHVASVPPGAVELEVRAGFQDLVVPAACRRALDEIVLWTHHIRRVERDWKARPSHGPLCLFCGPSGTGKSFAAEVLAGALAYRLLRADLGLLVSKYVGETEKNLNALFDAVAEQPVVLLFDEADALFGRRAEVKEARDRYANMEVSHLLARIERHRGPCVLTSNLRQNIDSAFLRRFHAVAEFPRPDLAARAALWTLQLPPSAPRAAELDPVLLARSVALSGGQIHNAALRAAVLASAEDVPIGLSQVARAVFAELAKEGRELSRDMLGELATYLPEGFA